MRRNFFLQGLREVFIRPADHLAPVDGLRAIAILYVILFHSFLFMQDVFVDKKLFIDFMHAFPTWLVWVWQGDKGVDIFFVLSGFLISGFLLRDQRDHGSMDFRKFYQRRLTRILPLYFFALFIYALPGGGNVNYIWANLFFVNNFLPTTKIFIPWSWSLTVEVQFYLVIPFVLWLLLKWSRPMVGLFMVLLFMVLVRVLVTVNEPILFTNAFADNFLFGAQPGGFRYAEALYVNLYTRVAPLLLGCVAGYLHSLHREAVCQWFLHNVLISNLVWIILFSMTIAMLFHPTTYVPSSDPRFSVEINLIYIALGRNLFALTVMLSMLLALYGRGIGGGLRVILSLRLWFPIAQTSYSIYLFHVPFLALAFLLYMGADKIDGISVFQILTIAATGTGFAFLFGMLTYALVERPSNRLLHRRKTGPVTHA